MLKVEFESCKATRERVKPVDISEERELVG